MEKGGINICQFMYFRAHVERIKCKVSGFKNKLKNLINYKLEASLVMLKVTLSFSTLWPLSSQYEQF